MDNFLIRQGRTNVSKTLDRAKDFGSEIAYFETISESGDTTSFPLPGYLANIATDITEFIALHCDNLPLRPGNGVTLDTTTGKFSVPINTNAVAVLWGWFSEKKNLSVTLPSGTLNIINGLAAYRLKRKNETGLGQGGIDIIFDGDSILEGYTATNLTFGSAAHFVKIALQQKFNPPGVQGGYGFLPFQEGSVFVGAGIIGTTDGFYDPWIPGPSGNYGVQGGSNFSTAFSINGKLMIALQEATHYMGLNIDGTLPAEKRMQATSVQFVGGKYANHGNTIWDVKEGSLPDKGQGTKTGFHKHGSAVFNQSFGAQRFGEAFESGYDKFITLNPTANNFLRISGGQGSSNPGSVGDATVEGFGAFDGAILYNGDENCGVRVHTNSYFGRQINQQAQYLLDGQKADGTVPFSVWTGGGAGHNGALSIMDSIINDCNDNGFGQPNVSLADYEARYRSIIERKQSLGMSVLVYCPMKPGIPYIVNETRVGKRWVDYADKQKALALEYNCGYYSEWDKFGRGEYLGGLFEAEEWNHPDLVHKSDKGQRLAANDLINILST